MVIALAIRVGPLLATRVNPERYLRCTVWYHLLNSRTHIIIRRAATKANHKIVMEVIGGIGVCVCITWCHSSSASWICWKIDPTPSLLERMIDMPGLIVSPELRAFATTAIDDHPTGATYECDVC